MKDQKPTYLNLPVQVARMAKMAAARAGVSLSEYIAHLITKDASETGIADLVVPDRQQDAATTEGGAADE